MYAQPRHSISFPLRIKTFKTCVIFPKAKCLNDSF